MELNCSDSGAKGKVALWAQQTCAMGRASLPAHPDTTGCWLSPWLLCVLLQVGLFYASQRNMMELEECVRFYRLDWGKNFIHLFKLQLKCQLLHETCLEFLALLHPLHLLQVKMNHSLIIIFIHCMYSSSFPSLNPQILHNVYCHQIGGASIQRVLGVGLAFLC